MGGGRGGLLLVSWLLSIAPYVSLSSLLSSSPWVCGGRRGGGGTGLGLLVGGGWCELLLVSSTVSQDDLFKGWYGPGPYNYLLIYYFYY